MKNGVFFRLSLSLPKKSVRAWKAEQLQEQRPRIPGEHETHEGGSILGGEVSVEGAKTLGAALATLAEMGMELEKKNVERWEKVKIEGKPHVRIETKGALKRDATVSQLVTWLKKQTERGEEHVEVEHDGKDGAVDVWGYLGGYDAYSTHFFPLLMLGAAAGVHGGKGELVFVADVELLDESVFVRATFGGDAVDLTIHDEPQDITEAQSRELEAGLGAGGTERIRAAHASWIAKFIEKKRRRMFAGCAGWLRPDGSWAIEPRFRSSGSFSEGLACVSERGPFDYGYIDQTGKLVIPYRFFAAGPFREGRALVKVERERIAISKHGERVRYGVGFIDRKGEWLIEPTLEHAEEFAEERAVFGKGELRGYIDLEGKVVVEPRYRHALAFVDGLALVAEHDQYEQGGFGFIDRTGVVAIPLRLECAGTFHKGFAVASKKGKWGFLDRKGSFLFEPRFDQCQYLVDDRAAARIGSKWGVVDGRGEVIIPFTHERIGPQGMWFMAGTEKSTTVYDARSGERLFRVPYSTLGEPRDGMVSFASSYEGPFGYLDLTGKVQIPARFSYAAPFSKGLAIVEDEDGRWGIIDETGAMKKPFSFRLFPSAGASHFAENGLAYVESSLSFGLVDREGRLVFPPELEALGGFGEDLIWAKYPDDD